MQHRRDVQGLRAVAIIAVLGFHFFPEIFPNGFLGVDIFFVISGYLIITILARQAEKSVGFSASLAGSFYYRRVKRILPLHLLYCAVAIILFTFKASPSIIIQSLKSAITGLTFVTNIHALFETNDYFERVLDENLFTHIWSLSVEMQFYLVVPFFFAIRESTSFGNMVLPTAACCSLLFYLATPSLVSFNLVIARFWQFFAISFFEERLREKETSSSALLPQCEHKVLEIFRTSTAEETRRQQRERFSMKNVVEQAVFLTALSVLVSVPLWPQSLPATLARIAVTAGTAVAIAFGKDAYFSCILGAAPLEFLGNISYSLYLIHWPIAVYLVRETPLCSPVRYYAVPLSLLITIIVYYFFERHYRQWSWTQIKWCCISLYIFCIGALFAVPSVNDMLNSSDISIADAIKTNTYHFGRLTENIIIPECTYSLWRNESRLTKPFGICEMPPGKGKLRFAVIGNSYAPNQADLVWKHFTLFYSTFTMFSQSSCEVFTYTRSGYCKHIANFTDVLDDLKPDVTFVIQRYGRPKDQPLPPPGKPDTAYEEMLSHLKAIENKTSLFFILDSFPSFHYYRMLRMNDMIRNNVPAEEINNVTTCPKEDLTARPRTQRLAAACSHCILYDIKPGLLDKKGRFCSYDGETHLALFQPSAHLTPWGRHKIEYIYEDLSKTYARQLRELEQRLYPIS